MTPSVLVPKRFVQLQKIVTNSNTRIHTFVHKHTQKHTHTHPPKPKRHSSHIALTTTTNVAILSTKRAPIIPIMIKSIYIVLTAGSTKSMAPSPAAAIATTVRRQLAGVGRSHAGRPGVERLWA